MTVIIPPDRQVSDARQMLQNEHGQAANIKSKSTKRTYKAQLNLRFLHSLSTEMLVTEDCSIHKGHHCWKQQNKAHYRCNRRSPQPLLSFRYRCDSKFELTQLEDMLIDKKSYGLFVIDRAEAAYELQAVRESTYRNIWYLT